MVEHAFQRVFLAQIRIAALNALLSAIYLAGALPLLGIHLPFTKTMIALTFVMGLLPIVGNLVSNTVVIIISLSYSLPLALGSLAFLVVIHKLEYFDQGSRMGAAACNAGDGGCVRHTRGDCGARVLCLREGRVVRAAPDLDTA
jgi:hypothetical protein